MSKPDFVHIYLAQLEKIIAQISREEIWAVVNALMDAWRKQKQIFLFGNGGSAATASHMANDLNKFTLVEGKPRFSAIAINDNVPLMTAWANDTTYENIFVGPLTNFLRAGDVVIGISCSGNSGNVLRAIEFAKAHAAVTIAFTGDTGGQLKNLADHCVFIPSAHIGQQEDGHMILDHVIVSALRELIEAEPV